MPVKKIIFLFSLAFCFSGCGEKNEIPMKKSQKQEIVIPEAEKNILKCNTGEHQLRCFFAYNGELYVHQPEIFREMECEESIPNCGVIPAKDVKIENGNPNTLEIIDSNFAKDKNQVYYWGNIVEKADSKTFHPLDWPKSEDRNFVFSRTKIIQTK